MPSRLRSFRVEAIILRHSDWGEADRLLVMFTLDMGKLRAIAKGVRKPRSRKAGHLEPFTRVSLQLARGRDMMIVTQAETIIAHTPLREDLLLSTYASYVVELLDRFTYEEGENRALYRLLNDTLTRISSSTSPDLAVRYYEVRLLDLVGFRPQLFNCVSCGKQIQPENQYFSAELGGVLCPACGKRTPGVRPVSMLALKYLRHFQRSNFTEAARVSLTDGLNREMENLMQHYLTYQLERGLNTPNFLRRVRAKASDQNTEEP
jgi:DNA repair protein RecO (recombination protein O)